MSFQVRITAPAERDMRANHKWWSEHRSAEQADRWLVEIDKLIHSLRETANRCGLATEIELRDAGIRQAPFGLGRRPSHRIIFAIFKQTVMIYRVRAFKQDAMTLAELD
jgi:plasmid stabilization system protein ParE